MAGIYIHIPFCKQACFYCDFHFSTSLKNKDALIQSLILELELRKDDFTTKTVKTIYFGGGTPSLLTNNELESILSTVYKHYKVAENPEITIEVNPDDLSANRIFQLSKSSINRLSIGVQSFFEDDLKGMNRAHNAMEAHKCLREATRYFDNITIDLIYGVPNMSLSKWNKNLQIAFDFGINHISSYALTVEPKTALDTFIKTGKYPPINEALALQHFNHLVEKTEKQGFVHYETSNFGKPNYLSKHNTSYWLGESYIGIGPSAHSYNISTRSWNVSNNSKYIQSIQNHILPNTVEVLSLKDRYNEFVMTGLRTIWGVSLDKIETDFGHKYLQYLNKVSKKYINQGLIEITTCSNNSNQSILKATPKGKFLVDGIASELFMI